MRWIGNECQEWSTNTILLTKPNVAPPVVTLLEDFVQRQTQSVSNCDRDGSSPANYPVLVYDPDPETLGCAIELAEGSCLCAIEGFTYPLRHWAVESGAVDLTSTLLDNDGG